jgi:sugar/nucleoside kinase (ribokinase family)
MSDPAVAILGNVNVDLIVRSATALPPPGQEWEVEAVEMRPGGAAANAGLALAALGVPVRVVGAVGDDPFGALLQDAFEARGLGDQLDTIAGVPTGVSLAFESADRDRSFLIALGSLAAFDRSMVPDELLHARYVLSCGTFTLPRMRGAPTAEILRDVRASGGTTLLDTGWDPSGWADDTRDEIAEQLPLVDVFLPNELEAVSITGAPDAETATEMLQERSGGWVVTKLGRHGCLAAGPGGEEHRVAAPSVVAADTTGAGDAFNAGLIAGLLEEKAFGEALELATRVASTVVTRPSADRYPAPDELLP